MIPPFEYQVPDKTSDASAVTLREDGGTPDPCHIFEPVDSGWVGTDREWSHIA